MLVVKGAHQHFFLSSLMFTVGIRSATQISRSKSRNEMSIYTLFIRPFNNTAKYTDRNLLMILYWIFNILLNNYHTDLQSQK